MHWWGWGCAHTNIDTNKEWHTCMWSQRSNQVICKGPVRRQPLASYLQLCCLVYEVGTESERAGGLGVGEGMSEALRLTGVGRAEGRRGFICSDLHVIPEGVSGPADGFWGRLKEKEFTVSLICQVTFSSNISIKHWRNIEPSRDLTVSGIICVLPSTCPCR